MSESQDQDEPQEQRSVQPFAEFLMDHRNGDLHHELSIALAQAVESVQHFGKPASVSLNIGIKPAGTADNQVYLIDDVRTKLPEAERKPKLLFIDRNGGLTKRDPDQTELPFIREVPDSRTSSPREVGKSA